jgi:hypothetical protein
MATLTYYFSLEKENTKSDGSNVHFDAMFILRGVVFYDTLSRQTAQRQMVGL